MLAAGHACPDNAGNTFLATVVFVGSHCCLQCVVICCLPERSVTIAGSCDMVMHIAVSIVMISE